MHGPAAARAGTRSTVVGPRGIDRPPSGLPPALPDPQPPIPGAGARVPLEPRPLAPGHRPDAQAGAVRADDLRFPINLATALRLSDARPLIVAAAQARVWVAEAELTRAKVLWIPDAQHRLRLHPPRRRRARTSTRAS